MVHVAVATLATAQLVIQAVVRGESAATMEQKLSSVRILNRTAVRKNSSAQKRDAWKHVESAEAHV